MTYSSSLRTFKEYLINIYSEPGFKIEAISLSKRYGILMSADDLMQEAMKKALEKYHTFKGDNFNGWIVRIMQNIAKDENKKIASKVRQKKQQNGDYKSEIDENGNPIWESDKSEGSYVNGELIWTDKPKWKKRQPVDIEDEIDEKGNPVRPEKQLLISNSVKGLSGDSQLQNDYSNKLIDWQEVVSILKKMNQKCQNILLLASEQYKYLEMSERLGIKLGTVESRLDRCRKRLYKELYG